MDYGYDFIDVTQYDGVLRSDNYMSIGAYKQIYNTLVSSCTSSGVPDISSPVLEFDNWANSQNLKNSKSKTSNSANIALSGLLYNYSKFNPNALSNNKIQVVNGKYDDKYINGVWQNPYDSSLSFAISSSTILINKSDVSVSLPTSLWHSNTSVNKIEIDFGNGTGYKSILNGSIASTAYNSTGFYTWTYRIQLSNGQYKYARQKIEVTELTDTSQNNTPICTNISITADEAYLGVKGTATLQIRYADGNCEIRNPLIVVEGLDTGLLGQGGNLGDNDISNFTSSIVESFSTDLQNLLTNTNSTQYDIIYVNWDNGTDYIQRNAYVLEEVIKWVNQKKAANGSSEPNVVLGQSMGGLIARYALKDMEDNNLDHDTSIYVSHDAPHQGAHIPMGLLYMARHIAKQFISTPLGGIEIPLESGSDVGLATVSEILDAPAIKQMLINNVNSSLNPDNTFHDNWQTELKNMGYPQQTRNISLSNASHCAEGYNLASNETLLEVTGKGSIGGFDNLIVLLSPFGYIPGYILGDFETFALGFLLGRSELDAEFRVKAFPQSGTAQIYKGRLTFKKNFLWLIPITRTITNVQKDSPSGTLFFDNYPGGAVPGAEDYSISSGNNYNLLFANASYDVNANPNFSFISAVSALDVGSENAPMNESDYIKAYSAANPPTGTKTIPFVNFTTSYNTSSTNEPHISFNSLNGDWLAEELDNDTTIDIFDCSFVCNNLEIDGINNVCNSSTTYSLPDFDNTSYDWTVTPTTGLNLVNSNTNIVTLNVEADAAGTYTLSVDLTNSNCGTSQISKTITVGKPKYSISPLDSNAPSTQAWAYINGDGVSLSFQGISHPTFSVVSSSGTSTIYILGPYSSGNEYKIRANGSNNSWSKTIDVHIQNSCGTITKRVFLVPPPPSGGCDYTLQSTNVNTYSLLPPPDCLSGFQTTTSTESSVMMNSEVAPPNIFSIKVYNMNGALLLETDEQSINLDSLKKGFYIIKATWNGNETTKKIAKK